MRMIFKVSFYVRSNYENKSGKSPLIIRIYLNKEMLNVGSSGIYLDKKLWCKLRFSSYILQKYEYYNVCKMIVFLLYL